MICTKINITTNDNILSYGGKSTTARCLRYGKSEARAATVPSVLAVNRNVIFRPRHNLCLLAKICSESCIVVSISMPPKMVGLRCVFYGCVVDASFRLHVVLLRDFPSMATFPSTGGTEKLVIRDASKIIIIKK